MSLFVAFVIMASQAGAAPDQSNPPQATWEAPASADSKVAQEVDRAWGLIANKRPAEAIAIVDPLITSFHQRLNGSSQVHYCARSMSEAILYSGLAATAKLSATILDENWCYAHFLKAFALIDLGRSDEAKAHLDRAIALAPWNAQFLAERGEWHKTRKDWSSALADFEQASTAAEFSPEIAKASEKARALRGIAFVKIEKGEFDEAEKLLKQSLELDPDSAVGKSELDYVRSLRPN